MKKQTVFRIKEELLQQLKQLAAARNESLNKLVEDILFEFMDSNDTVIDSIEFKTYHEIESYFLKNMKKWKIQRKATKIIGKKLFVFTK